MHVLCGGGTGGGGGGGTALFLNDYLLVYEFIRRYRLMGGGLSV